MSVLLHDLGHSAVALQHHLPIRSITLFIFGGIAQVGKEPDRPLTELEIAIAGPLVSFALAVVFGMLGALGTPSRYSISISRFFPLIVFQVPSISWIVTMPSAASVRQVGGGVGCLRKK